MIQTILIVILIASLQGVLGGRSGLTRFYIITVPSFMSTYQANNNLHQRLRDQPTLMSYQRGVSQHNTADVDVFTRYLHSIMQHGRWEEVIKFNKDN